jgi:hypothetical protein
MCCSVSSYDFRQPVSNCQWGSVSWLLTASHMSIIDTPFHLLPP